MSASKIVNRAFQNSAKDWLAIAHDWSEEAVVRLGGTVAFESKIYLSLGWRSRWEAKILKTLIE